MLENSALRARFDSNDHDADGKINEAEFGQLLDALGVGFSSAQVHHAFGSIDVNQSGFIDYEEFCVWWTHR
jgi:Ca2+-binding EF-hand superfamily protein